MTSAIEISNLSKKYLIDQQGQGRSNYRALRDVLVDKATNLFKPRVPQITTQDFWALRDIDLTIQQGERVGIIGRNGAGKSTLLKIISRITHPTTGQIKIAGRISSLLEVGTGFHPELTGRENIFLNGAIMGMGKQEIIQKFDEIVAFAGVEQFLDTPVKRYSSGMYTRLAFAVAAHLDSDILIVDEVLAVGDAEFQKKCLGKMDEMGQKHGRTILFVSHNINVINSFCNRVVHLQKGRLIDDSKDVRQTTMRYLQNDTDGSNAYWIADDQKFMNPYCAPEEFYLGDKDGKPLQTGTIANNDECYIYLKFNAAQLDSGLTIGYAIYSEGGEQLYWSYQTDRAENNWPEIVVGTNILRSPFPKRLLNEGTYRIEWIGGLHFRNWLFEPGKHTPAIQVTIQGGLSDSPIWINRRPGLFAPDLPWEKM